MSRCPVSSAIGRPRPDRPGPSLWTTARLTPSGRVGGPPDSWRGSLVSTTMPAVLGTFQLRRRRRQSVARRHGVRSLGTSPPRAGTAGVRLPDLRHWQATQLLDAGVPVPTVAARLGHADGTTTMKIYAHRTERADEQAALVVGAALNPVAGKRR